MLDLNKLEAEIENFISTQTADSYNDIFNKLDLIGLKNTTEISGGYATHFDCPADVVVVKANIMESVDDFSFQDLRFAA